MYLSSKLGVYSISKPPYPEYSPNFRVVSTTGGYQRTCLVIELLTLAPLTGVELALVQEQLEATLDKIRRQLATLEISKVISTDQFDRLLLEGLRLPGPPRAEGTG